jgi:hypothetical protein
MLDTGGVTHILTLITESKINILFENIDRLGNCNEKKCLIVQWFGGL